ncbi:MAG: repressor LexA, partial [Akkermansiaceae bacterium]|nr:repressor LexA [Akkermansiaceae bacterium]
MDTKLTKRQQELLDFLHQAHRETGVMPSTREIQAHFGFASQTAAMSHLRALERKGAIKRLAGKARAVIFPEDLEREEIVDIPLYGEIAAGMPQDAGATTGDGFLSIDKTTLGLSGRAKTFALRVRGDSMIDAHICDGDTAVLE